MSKTLKQLLNQVCQESGFDTPSQYIGNQNDPNIITLVAISQRVAALQRDLQLNKLVKQANISLTNGTPTSNEFIFSYALPSDFYSLVPDTVYQTGRIDPASLPTNPAAWAYLSSRSGPQGMRVYCRFINDRLYVFSPEGSQTLAFEYISNKPIQAVTPSTPVPTTNPTYLQEFANDNDIWLLDDPLFEMDVKWRYKREKGIEGWQADQQDYQLYENRVRADNGGAQTIYPPGDWPYPGMPYTNLWVPET